MLTTVFSLFDKLFSKFRFWTFLKLSNFEISKKVFSEKNQKFSCEHNAHKLKLKNSVCYWKFFLHFFDFSLQNRKMETQNGNFGNFSKFSFSSVFRFFSAFMLKSVKKISQILKWILGAFPKKMPQHFMQSSSPKKNAAYDSSVTKKNAAA